MRRTFALVAVVLLSLSAVTGCGASLSEEGEPLTIEQSEALAQVRFQLASAGDGVLEVRIGADEDIERVVAEVTVDFSDGVAWGTLERGPEGIAVAETVAFSPELYLIESADGWQQSTYPSPFLSIVFALGADRPENASLLRQSDASYLGTSRDEGLDLQVFRVPSVEGEQARTRMWIDDDGAMRRVDAGDDDTLVIRTSDADPTPWNPRLDAVFGSTDG
ncbi:MAG: hypothetical protein ACQEW8_11920 [Actinomycetota bacterium]